jgi:outer membrane lipoprotein-sorting protein
VVRRATLPLIGLLLASCASVHLPAPEVAARARATRTYNGRLHVKLDGRELRARATVLLAFERPDRLRIEVPGPGGLRLVAVTRADQVIAAFPADRAVFTGAADAAGMEALLGVALTPAEVMDLLVGSPPSRLASSQIVWGPVRPRKIDARLQDGSRLQVTVEEADTDADLPAAAFEAPPSPGYRAVTADEARSLWGRR